MKLQKIVALGLVLALCSSALVGCTGSGMVGESTGTVPTSESTTELTTLSSRAEQGGNIGQSGSSEQGGVNSSQTTETTTVLTSSGEVRGEIDYFAVAPSSSLVEDYKGEISDLKPYKTDGGAEQAGGADYKLPHLKSDSPDAKVFNDFMEKWAESIVMYHQDATARQGMVFRNRYTTIEYGDYISILVKHLVQSDYGDSSELGGAFVYNKKEQRFLNFYEILAAGGVMDSGKFVASIEDELVNQNLVTDQYPYQDGYGTSNLKFLNFESLAFTWALGYRPEAVDRWYYPDAEKLKAGGFDVEGQGVYLPPVSVFLDAEGQLCILSKRVRLIAQNLGEEMRQARITSELRTWRYADLELRDGGVYDQAYENACKKMGIDNPMEGPEAFVVYLGDQDLREPYARTQWVVDLAPDYDKHYIFDVIKSVYYPDEEYYAIIPKNKKMGVVVMSDGKEFVGLSTVGSTIVGVAKGQQLGLWYRDRLMKLELKNDGMKMILDPNLPVIDLSDQIPEDQTADDEMMDFLRLFNLGVG